ncbi:preprotein translocase subunit YajC [Streptomyces hebeiensis]|uniref:Preprotein translocase subunit YajC n=1 Tax=Streptomyces hebeiensis TaxID=229486 RepID=A0ABN1UZ53_9ACTN
MSLAALFPFILLIGAMLLMTRSAKKKQQQAVAMRDQMQSGSGVRTIGGMYATVKEVRHDTVLLEVAPGVHAIYAKNAIGAVLEDDEYNRIVHGDDPIGDDTSVVVPDDASSLTDADATVSDDTTAEAAEKPEKDAKDAEDTTDGTKIDLVKGAEADGDAARDVKDAKPEPKDGKGDGDTDAK